MSKPDTRRPAPRFGDWLISKLCKPHIAEGLIGDLHEYYEALPQGKWSSKCRYWFQVFNVLRPFALRNGGFGKMAETSLVRYLFVFAMRGLWKQKLTTVLNVSGIALGLASCVFIGLYVLDELSYDRHWKDADRIFRMYNSLSYGEMESVAAFGNAPIADIFQKEFPQIEMAARTNFSPPLTFVINEKLHKETAVIYADQNLIPIFSFKAIHGNLEQGLTAPNTIVLTEELSTKLYGQQNPVGKVLTVNDGTSFKITAVIEDLPENSHLKFSALRTTINDRWSDPSKVPLLAYWTLSAYRVYVKLKPDVDPVELERDFERIYEHYFDPVTKAFSGQSWQEFIAEGNTYRYGLQPLKNIHLYSNFTFDGTSTGDIQYVLLFSSIGVLILAMAFINFINLTTAGAVNRIKEIAIKKVVGSSKSSLIWQFLLESLLVSWVGLVLAVGICYSLLPYFNLLAAKNFTDPLFNHHQMWLFSLVVTSGAALLAGIYPSIAISRGKPSQLLKPRKASSRGNVGLRQGLVVFQFTVSIILITGSLVINRQLEYGENQDVGYNRDRIIVVDEIDDLGPSQEAFRSRIIASKSISHGSMLENLPSDSWIRAIFMHEQQNKTLDGKVRAARLMVDQHMLATFDIKLTEGRNFSDNLIADSSAMIISESAVRALGLDEPIGATIRLTDGEEKAFTVIGVTEDFHLRSIHFPSIPICLIPTTTPRKMVFQFNANDVAAAKAEIEQVWAELAPDQVLQLDFINDRYKRLYQSEKQLKSVFNFFTYLALSISILGLFGISSLVIGQRTKETGVRKVLGASVTQLVLLLNFHLTRPILLALILGIPASYLLMDKWLSSYAYKIEIGIIALLAPALFCLLLAWLVITFHTLNSARQNPADTLKYE